MFCQYKLLNFFSFLKHIRKVIPLQATNSGEKKRERNLEVLERSESTVISVRTNKLYGYQSTTYGNKKTSLVILVDN